MDPQPMTPQESLNLIKQVILDAKQRQEENGVIYMYWGATIAMVSIAHYVLQQIGEYELIFVPYLFIPVAAIVSFFIFPYYKKNSKKNEIGSIIGMVWLFAGANMMFMGFALVGRLGANLIPLILMFQGLALGVSGVAVKSRALIVAGLLANVVGLLAFWIPVEYHPLLTAAVGFFSLIVPGILLNNAYRKRKHV